MIGYAALHRKNPLLTGGPPKRPPVELGSGSLSVVTCLQQQELGGGKKGIITCISGI